MNKNSTSTPGVPSAFVSKFGQQITGFLSGFDRLRFHGTLRMLFQPEIFEVCLLRQGVLVLVLQPSRCTHLYHYFLHPQFGLLHVRGQTWFPFTVDICLNGRQWLARQMTQAGLDFDQRDNGFVRVSDPARAQALLDEQLKTDWPKVLDALLSASAITGAPARPSTPPTSCSATLVPSPPCTRSGCTTACFGV